MGVVQDRDIVEATARRMQLPVSMISNEEEQGNELFEKRKYPLGSGLTSLKDEIFQVQSNIIQDLASRESCIIVGRCGHYVLREHPRSLHLYIYAPYEDRLRNCIEVLRMDEKTAHKMIKEVDKARDAYRRFYAKGSESIFDAFDIMLDSHRFGIEGCVKLIQCFQHSIDSGVINRP